MSKAELKTEENQTKDRFQRIVVRITNTAPDPDLLRYAAVVAGGCWHGATGGTT